MSLFDAKKYNLDTNDPIEVVLSRLKANVDRDRIVRVESKQDKSFHGTISSDGFKIRKIVNYRSSYVPTIEGKLIKRTYGTNVRLKVYAHPIVLLFMIIWFSLLVGFIIMTLLSTFSNTTALIVIPFLLIFGLVGISSASSGYKKEWKKSEDLLYKIIKNEKSFNPDLKIEPD